MVWVKPYAKFQQRGNTTRFFNYSLCWLSGAGDYLKERAFPRTVLPDNAYSFPRFNTKIDAPDYPAQIMALNLFKT
jgi:hypothetical protein